MANQRRHRWLGVGLAPLLGLLLAPALALAHAHLLHSEPAEGSVVKGSPPELVLEFSEAAQLTAVTIQNTPTESRVLEHLPQEKAARLRLELPPLLPGAHTVLWRVLSADGHVASGEIHFRVASGAERAAVTGPAPMK